MSSPPALSAPARLRWWLNLLVGIGLLQGQDAAGRLSFESVFVAGDAAQNQVTSYSYNAANNRTEKTLVSGSGASSQTETWSYSYNSLNQLVGMTKTTAAGVEVVSYGYDANGNRTSRTASSGIDHYRWDEENRLQSTTKGAQGWRYGYDYRTRRVSIQEGSGDPTGSQFVLNKVTAVVFRDGVSVSEYEGATEAAVRADAAVPTVSYVRGPDLGGGVGGLVASLRYSGPGQAPLVRYNLSNGRGDVVAQTDASGTVTWTGSYEGFGTRTAETGTNLDRQRANTKEEDPTGLLNEGFRYRDLETGTWLSRDPAGFVDGPNLYAYVKCNPWSAFDPEGLFLEYLIDKLDIHVSQPIADAIGDRISGETCAALAGNKAFGVLQGAAEAAHTGSKAALGTLVPGSGTLHAGEAVLSGEGSFADLGKAVVQDIGGKKLNQALSAGEALTAAASGDLQGAVSSAAGVLGGKGKGKGGSGKPVTQTTGQQGDVAANTERVRHYTNRKGSKGIESDGVIKAQDNNRVYVEPANRKPLPQAKAESKYQLKEGRGRDYIETDVDASRVEWVKNPRYGTKEMTVKGDLELHNSEVTRRK